MSRLPAQKQLATTIADGTGTSAVIDLGDNLLCAIGKGTDVEGASITFTGSVSSGGTYRTIKNSAGVAITLACTTGTSEIITIDDPTVFTGIQFVKVVFGTNQTGIGTLELYCIPV